MSAGVNRSGGDFFSPTNDDMHWLNVEGAVGEAGGVGVGYDFQPTKGLAFGADVAVGAGFRADAALNATAFLAPGKELRPYITGRLGVNDLAWAREATVGARVGYEARADVLITGLHIGAFAGVEKGLSPYSPVTFEAGVRVGISIGRR